MAQELRTFGALEEDPAPTQQLTNTFNPSRRGYDTLFCFLGHQA